MPGAILAPSGLTYDAVNDILYFVDGEVNSLVAISNPATIPAGGIVVKTAPWAAPTHRVKVVYHGYPLKAPISSALLFNGDLVVGNTANNVLLEISPAGRLAGSRRSTPARGRTLRHRSIGHRRKIRRASTSTTTTTRPKLLPVSAAASEQ